MILVLTFVAASFTVQAPPDLSGTWTLDPNRSASTGGGTGARDNEGGGRGGGLGLGPAAEQLTIRQDATAIVIEERRGTTTASLTYALHGGKTTNAVSVGRNSGGSAVYVTAWRERRLVTSITMPGARGGRPLNTKKSDI
jgi:hypothetical protein